MTPFFTTICPGEVDFEVTTYLYKPDFKDKFGELTPEEGLVLGYATKLELSDPNNSPFVEYNAKMFEALEKYRGI